jgi:hypothetical protein
MTDKQILGSAFEAAELCGVTIGLNEKGKKKRSTAYALVDRLPEEMKVKVGKSLKVNLPKLREWIDNGGHREAA